jgi:phosphoribosylanthranilate isomerase
MSYKIKICGLSTLDQINMAKSFGADMIGFIFASPSPREITPSYAKNLSFLSAAKDLERVAVFVEPDNKFLQEAVHSIDANLIQLHGNETPGRCLEIKSLTGLPIIKSIGVSNIMDIKGAQQYINHVDYFLFDAKPSIGDKSQKGGLNKVFDWSLLKEWTGPKYILSGGLNIKNVEDAIKMTDAVVIDVSSGVESEPGIKNEEMIKNFIDTTKSAFGKRDE